MRQILFQIGKNLYGDFSALGKNQYLAPGWTEKRMKDIVRYYSRLRWLEHVPFEDYGLVKMPLFDTCGPAV